MTRRRRVGPSSDYTAREPSVIVESVERRTDVRGPVRDLVVAMPGGVDAKVLEAGRRGVFIALDDPDQYALGARLDVTIKDGGRKAKGVLVEQRPATTAQFSLAATYDGTAKRPVLLAAASAGNLDDLADEHPEKVVRRHFSALSPFSDYLAKELVASLGLKGDETITIKGLAGELKPRQRMEMEVTSADGSVRNVPVHCRIDTLEEVEYFRNGGILHYVLRQLAA